MNQINFKSRVKMMTLISFIGSIFLIGLIIAIITKHLEVFIVNSIAYIWVKILGNIIWKCPKCKTKLPKGKYTNTINKYSYCNYELIQYLSTKSKNINIKVDNIICPLLYYISSTFV